MITEYKFQAMPISLSSRLLVGGPLQQMLRRISILLADREAFLFHDARVGQLYGHLVTLLLRQYCATVQPVLLPQGDGAKTIETYTNCCHEVLESSTSADPIIIALGGGATTNIAGFVAATVNRGLPLVLIPTTLLAQVDAAIDSKQGINTIFGKNTLGAIYHANAVLVDSTFLATLDLDDFTDGFAEIAKHGFAQERSLLGLLENHPTSIDTEDLSFLISRTIALKLLLLQRADASSTLVLQYGHAIGHAIECATKFTITHGKAISIGMVATADLSAKLGIATKETASLHRSVLSKLGLPTRVPKSMDLELFREFLSRDKYSTRGGPVLGLVGQPGTLAEGEHNSGFIVSPGQVVDVLRDLTD